MTGDKEQRAAGPMPGGASARLALLLLLAACGLLLACAGEPMAPTATAVPLGQTATPRSQATREPATATVVEPPAEPTSDGAAAEGDGTADFSAIEEALARRTVEDLLARLVRGESVAAAQLYLTEEARAAGLETVLHELAGGDAPLAEASLLTLEPAPPKSYRAEAALRREGDREATERVTLHLVYRRGLWLVDDASVDGGAVEDGSEGATPEVAAPTLTPAPTQAPAAGSSTGSGRASSALTGRITFQTSSGGDIYVVNADGSGLKRITDGLDPAWSPSGDRIAFTRWRSPWGVYVIRPDGSPEERIVDGDKFKEVTWAPGGRRLAFLLTESSGEPVEVCFYGYCVTIPPYSLGQIWVVDLDSGDLKSLPVDPVGVHSPTWSPAGGRIVYAGEQGLSWIDLDPGETGTFASSSAWDGSPAYAPDEKRIAFMGRVHNRWEILVMNADGSERRQLTESDPDLEEPPHNVAPAWSPDGKHIAFLSNRDGRWRIYVMNADGTRQRPMFAGAADEVRIVYDWASERVVSWGPVP